VFDCVEGTSCISDGSREGLSLLQEATVELYDEEFGCSAHEFGLHGQYVRYAFLQHDCRQVRLYIVDIRAG